MANDPVNVTDPSGGLSINFGTINTLGRIGVAAAGAAIGYAADRLSGGNGWKGAAIGGGLALGATFIPPFDISTIAGVLTASGATIAVNTVNIGASVVSNPLVVQSNPYAQFAGSSQTSLKNVDDFTNDSYRISNTIPINVSAGRFQEGGALSSRSFNFTQMTGNMFEAGVSGLFYQVNIFLRFQEYLCWLPEFNKRRQELWPSRGCIYFSRRF
jgi:hypothetical protein